MRPRARTPWRGRGGPGHSHRPDQSAVPAAPAAQAAARSALGRTHPPLLTRDDRPRSRVSVQGPGTSGPGWSSSISAQRAARATNRSIALAACRFGGSRAARCARRAPPLSPSPPRRGGPFYDVNRALGCNIIPIYLILLNTETDCLRGPIDCMLLAALARPTLGSHRSSGASSRRQGPRWSVRRW